VEEDEDDFGPGFGPSAPTEEAGDGLTAEERKRQKRIRLLKQKKEENAEAYRILESRLPCAAMYEKSYMHRTELSHIAVTKTDFVITASTDGVVKFWKKTSPGIEFVKTYRAHMGPLTGLSVSFSGDVAVTSGSGEDKTLRLFDVETYDMTQMIDLPYTPSAVCVVDLETDDSDAVPVKRLGYVIAVAEANTGKVHLYHVPTMSRLGVVKPFATKQLHAENAYIHIIRYHPKRRFCLSADTAGNIEAWSLHEAREAISDFSAAYSAVEKPKPSDSAIRVAESIVEDIIAESMPSADSSAATSASGELHPEVLGDPKGVSFDMKLDVCTRTIRCTQGLSPYVISRRVLLRFTLILTLAGSPVLFLTSRPISSSSESASLIQCLLSFRLMASFSAVLVVMATCGSLGRTPASCTRNMMTVLSVCRSRFEFLTLHTTWTQSMLVGGLRSSETMKESQRGLFMLRLPMQCSMPQGSMSCTRRFWGSNV